MGWQLGNWIYIGTCMGFISTFPVSRHEYRTPILLLPELDLV